jgi:hypothetical protein
VQPVRAPARLSGRARIAAAVVVTALAAALVVTVVAPGGDARAPGAGARSAGHVAAAPVTLIGGKALQSARCRQWRAASVRRRDAVVATLADVVGGPTPYGPASTLPADVAHRLFDRTCGRPYARGFLLYELYTRAAAFYAAPRRDL